jgi:hypothetical protein
MAKHKYLSNFDFLKNIWCPFWFIGLWLHPMVVVGHTTNVSYEHHDSHLIEGCTLYVFTFPYGTHCDSNIKTYKLQIVEA